MTPHMRLAEVFEKGLSQGVEKLSPGDHELYLIQLFILDHEMSDLSGYLYNHLPRMSTMTATVAAMRQHGLVELAALLGEAIALFQNYSEPESPSTWNQILQQYDPTDRIDQLNRLIDKLDYYGLDQSDIQ